MSEPEIREARESDAGALLNLYTKLDWETSFMLYEPGERRHTADEMRRRIREVKAQENSTLLVVDGGGELVGLLGAFGGRVRRKRHSALIIVGILQEFTGRGIGTRLFERLEAWARRSGVHRLELTVMTHNTAGIALYRKMGFEIEGTRKHSLLVDGRYVDEYAMAKLLD
jgi:RimJ/RimL family protein N-acetyltransferase